MAKYAVLEIIWDADDAEDIADLPTAMEVEVADGLSGDELDEAISDAITEATGFCHKGFAVET